MKHARKQKQRQHAADGGLITGPGTTTSDSVKTHMRPGSYVLPADTTAELTAPDSLTIDGKLAPVAVSDGEYQLTPEQVQQVGERVLDVVREATHAPADTNFGFGGGRQYLADGGRVLSEEELRKLRARDTAAYEAQRRALNDKFYKADPMGPPKPAAPSALSRGATATANVVGGAVNTSRGLVNRAIGPAGAAALAVPALIAARDPNATARYAERFAMNEPTGDGSFGDIMRFGALTGLGFASEVGSTLTGGLSDRLYADKQAVDTEQLRQTVGGVPGAYAGNKVGTWVGKGVDAAGRLATRGRYTGNLGEKVLGGLGTVGGFTAGGNAANYLFGEEPLAPQQQGAATAVNPAALQQAPGQADPLQNNIIQNGTSFSSTGPITAGYTVNGRPSNEADPLWYYADNPAEALEQNWRTKLNLFERTPRWGGGNTGVPGEGGANAGGMAPFGFRPGENTGGSGPRATLIRNSGTPSNAEILRERMRNQRTATNAQAQSAADQAAIARDSLDLQRAAAEQQARIQQQQALVAARAEQRMEVLRQAYAAATTDEERAQIALAMRDLQGQPRPQPQIATVDELINPADTTQGVRKTAFIVDQAGARELTPGGGRWPTPTAANINALRKGMASKELFEAEFGPGSAARYGAK